MAHFFEDVGSFIAEPFRDIGGILGITDDPKRNSFSDVFNGSFGPDNRFSKVVGDLPGTQLLKDWTGADLSSAFQAPDIRGLSKPGQYFSDAINLNNKALPTAFQPYAQPLEAAALSAFNPFAGAAFETAYQGGQQQEQQKGFDWGDLGKNAAINFGTAGATSLANDALSSANAARQSGTALNAFNNGSSSALQSTVDAAKAGTQGAVSAFSSPASIAGTSFSTIPFAAGLQSSGKGIADTAYTTGVNAAKTLAGPALTATLAPQGTQPIAGALDNFAPLDSGGVGASQYGDVLNAFGGGEINTANPNGPRISPEAFNSSVSRLASNDYLQQNQQRDVSLPAGQFQPSQNTPYANRLTDINKGTTQAYADLLDQTNNANSYYSIIDANPGLTSDQLNTYLNNPGQGALGNFTVDPATAAFLQNIHPLGPMNMSLL